MGSENTPSFDICSAACDWPYLTTSSLAQSGQRTRSRTIGFILVWNTLLHGYRIHTSRIWPSCVIAFWEAFESICGRLCSIEYHLFLNLLRTIVRTIFWTASQGFQGLQFQDRAIFPKLALLLTLINKILSTAESGFDAQNLLKFCPEYWYFNSIEKNFLSVFNTSFLK